jgi:hypothetical protein
MDNASPEVLHSLRRLVHPIIPEKIPDLAGIAARHRVRRLGIFGSAAGDRFDPASTSSSSSNR